jgi:hypothetical protein
MEELAKKGMADTVIADTAHGSDFNRNTLAGMGAELASAVSGKNIGTKNGGKDAAGDAADGVSGPEGGKGREAGKGCESADGWDASDQHLALADNESDACDRDTFCPAGRKAETSENKAGNGFRAQFDREARNACPKKGKCPVKVGTFKASMGYTSKTLRVAVRRKKQETKEFKRTYRMRSGIEAKNSELNFKFAHQTFAVPRAEKRKCGCPT